MNRNEIQENACRLILDNDHVVLEWPTGLGKTRASCMIMEALSEKKREAGLLTPLKVLILVPEVILKENWTEELKKWMPDDLMDMEILCYNSMYRRTDQRYDLLICDELHHIGSEKRLDILGELDFYKFLGLSATIGQELKDTLGLLMPDIIIDSIPMREAMEEGIIPDPEIVLVPLDLDDLPEETIVIERGKKEKRITLRCKYREMGIYNTKMYPNARLEITCSAKEAYEYWNFQTSYWKEKYTHFAAEHIKTKWLRAGLQRKRIMGTLKTKAARELIGMLEGMRFICFCTDIRQADELHENAIHSKKDNPREMIEKYNRGEINSLFAVGMLQEGHNLKDTEIGIMIQLDGEPRGFIQKVGRIIRGKNPVIYILYIKGTRDEGFLMQALVNVNKEKIRTWK